MNELIPKPSDLRTLRRGTETNRGIEKTNVEKTGRMWPVYARGKDAYFGKNFGFGEVMTAEQAEGIVTELHETHEQVMGVDIMGQATACFEIGCDQSIGVTLPLPEDFKDKELFGKTLESRGIKLVEGDVFSEETIQQLLDQVDAFLAQEGNALGAVMYRPVGGDSAYRDNNYAVVYLFKRLFVPLFERLSPGGFFAINMENMTPEVRELFLDAVSHTFGPDTIKYTTWNARKDQFSIRKGPVTVQF